MSRRVERPGVRAGYDLWASTYDATPNPLVALDRRHTLAILAPRAGECVLDAGCGTGATLAQIRDRGARAVGLDGSLGMLRVAQRRVAERSVARTPLVQADLDDRLPLRAGCLDAALCALVGEHLTRPAQMFADVFAALQRGGRFVFSVFHPELAAAGIEANFACGGTEYRLGAQRHSVDDYVNGLLDAGFTDVRAREFAADAALAAQTPSAAKFLGRPLLLVVQGRRAA